MTWAVTAVAAASAIVSARTSWVQQKAAQNTANYNAQVAELEAQDAARRGDLEAARLRRQNAQLASSALPSARTGSISATARQLTRWIKPTSSARSTRPRPSRTPPKRPGICAHASRATRPSPSTRGQAKRGSPRCWVARAQSPRAGPPTRRRRKKAERCVLT